jgi:hypothetical protein
MNQTDYAAYLLTLPLSQIRAIKKAVNVMCRAGINRDDALRIIVEQRQSHGR